VPGRALGEGRALPLPARRLVPAQLRARPASAGRDPRRPRAAVATATRRRRLAQLLADARATDPRRRAAAAGLTRPAVRDRCPPVAAERLRPELHAGRGLAALVLRAVDHRERALDDVGI